MLLLFFPALCLLLDEWWAAMLSLAIRRKFKSELVRRGHVSHLVQLHLNAPPPSFHLSHAYNERSTLGFNLERQLAIGKPVNLRWLFNASSGPGSISVNGVEFDRAQDLLLLMHYDPPSYPGSKGIRIYPVQLSQASSPFSYGIAITHRKAHEAIAVEWEPSDYPPEDQEDALQLEMFLCGAHVALFLHCTQNPRVIICNWKTGMKVAMVDSWQLYTSASVPNAVHPSHVTRFAWLSHDAFMIASVEPYKGERQDALYVYRLVGDFHAPLLQSIALEVPSWHYDLRNAGFNRHLGIVTGSWSEDVNAGAQPYDARNRITALTDEAWGYSRHGPLYSIYYVIRNDVLLDEYLAHHSGRVLRWDEWSRRCVQVFPGPRRAGPADIQVNGSMVMSCFPGARGAVQIKVNDFNTGRRTSGKLVRRHNWVAVQCGMLEQGGLWTDLAYRSVFARSYDRRISFILVSRCLFHIEYGNGWRSAGCMYL
ncbi:unnamed protein product [Peniophora sp. CBMAI 1063]|nr:unnamed protein product [Peniophora sp. CBMAI 1063]